MDTVEAAPGKLEDVLIAAKAASSKREAREFIKGNAVSVNGKKVNDPNMMIDASSAYVNNVVLIRRGKKKNYAVALTEAAE